VPALGVVLDLSSLSRGRTVVLITMGGVGIVLGLLLFFGSRLFSEGMRDAAELSGLSGSRFSPGAVGCGGLMFLAVGALLGIIGLFSIALS